MYRDLSQEFVELLQIYLRSQSRIFAELEVQVQSYLLLIDHETGVYEVSPADWADTVTPYPLLERELTVVTDVRF